MASQCHLNRVQKKNNDPYLNKWMWVRRCQVTDSQNKSHMSSIMWFIDADTWPRNPNSLDIQLIWGSRGKFDRYDENKRFSKCLQNKKKCESQTVWKRRNTWSKNYVFHIFLIDLHTKLKSLDIWKVPTLTDSVSVQLYENICLMTIISLRLLRSIISSHFYDGQTKKQGFCSSVEDTARTLPYCKDVSHETFIHHCHKLYSKVLNWKAHGVAI